MKNYVALFKLSFGGDFQPGHRVSVPETVEEKLAVKEQVKLSKKPDIRYAGTVAEAKEKLLAWLRPFRQARGGEYKLVNEDTGQQIDDEIAASSKPAKG